MLKLLLKWRDYISRVEDESPTYMLHNSILFSLAKSIPKTKNEMRDICRNNVPPAI